MAANAQERIEQARQRNIQAKLDRVICACHGIVVTLDNINTFEWNHRDPDTKLFTVGGMLLRSDSLYFAEIAKCDLVCRSWHIEHTRLQRDDGQFKVNQFDSRAITVVEDLQPQLFDNPLT